MDIEKTYRVELLKPNKRARARLVQYIQAENMDDAIRAARLTFEAGLYGFGQALAGAQKACDKTLLKGNLVFGFKSGWITQVVDGLTIFDAYKKARANEFVAGEITEVYALPA